jgi:hypothetical protein
MIKKILSEVKDDTDKIILVAMLICTMFFIFIPALIVVLFMKNYISESTYNISKAFLNFELLMFLVSLLFAVPVIGWIAGFVLAPVMGIFNIVIVVIDLCAIAKKSELIIPVPYEFI